MKNKSGQFLPLFSPASTFTFPCTISNIRLKLYDIINVHVVSFVCGTWSFTMMETYRMEVFKNRVRRQIFGSERQNVTGDWRKWRSYDPH